MEFAHTGTQFQKSKLCNRWLTACHTIPGCALAAICFGFVPGYTINTPIVKVLATTVGWTIEIAVNVVVTGAIVGRLWYMGRRVSFAESKGSIAVTRPSIYLRTIFTIVESGALLVAVTISMLVLSHLGSPVALPFMDLAIQVAVRSYLPSGSQQPQLVRVLTRR